MQNWQIAILVVMAVFTTLGYLTYEADEGDMYFGKMFGVIGFVLLVTVGLIISAVIALTKFLL